MFGAVWPKSGHLRQSGGGHSTAGAASRTTHPQRQGKSSESLMGLGSLCQAIGDQLEPVDLEAHGDRRESDGIG